MPTADEVELTAVGAISEEALARDLSALVQAASPTGQERPAFERFAELAAVHGLEVDLHEHDLQVLRAHPEYPGEEASREELLGLSAALPGRSTGVRRLCLNGHLDVVGPGSRPWRSGPWSGLIEGGHVNGRGAVDMKGGLVAALHALAAVGSAGGGGGADVVLQAVAAEEDGGLGTFAALERDGRFEAALIPEPTRFELACAQAGALTFSGRVHGVAAHAAARLEGVSAIDRYLPVHEALAAHERELNADVRHPLMGLLPLPYPVSVGRLEAGGWSSSVPDRLVFEGRLGVPVGQPLDEARTRLEERLRAVCPDLELEWTGGRFAPAETPPGHPFVALVREAASAELGHDVPTVGVPYGADMRLFVERGVPCAMIGTGGLELAHAVDERVAVADLGRLARMLVRLIVRWAVD